MRNQSWSRPEILAAAGVLATLVAAFFAPTVHRWLRSDYPNASVTSAAESQPPQTLPAKFAGKTIVPAADSSSDSAASKTSQTLVPSTTLEPHATPTQSDESIRGGGGGLPTGSVDLPTTSAAAVPAQDALREEQAGPGTVQGNVAVCNYGVEPKKRNLRTAYSMNRDPICIQTLDGRLLRIPLDQHVLNVPPVYYQGRQYFLGDLEIGDYIEARLIESGDRETSLQDVRLIKSARAH